MTRGSIAVKGDFLLFDFMDNAFAPDLETTGQSRMTDGLMSSRTEEWPTPKDFFLKLNEEFHFTLDPCATKQNAKCAKFYTKAENGLLQSWANERVFMNPPYGPEIKKWMQKAYEESLKGATVACLVHSRTDTAWWHDFAMKASEIRFVRGRLKFGAGTGTAPFPSAVVIFRPRMSTLTFFGD